MRTGELLKGNLSAYQVPNEVSITGEDAALGVNLNDNDKVTVTTALNTCNVANTNGEGILSFTAGDTTVFAFPANSGWVGEQPVFKVGYYYNVVYYYGGFYADQGRLML